MSETTRRLQHADTYMSRLVDYGFSGSIVVEKSGRVLLEQGFGIADRERGVTLRPSAIFDIGSITKQFTATAILLLESEGKLSVKDRIIKYWPAAAADKADITLHQLLTHTSGLAEGFGGDYERVTRNDLVRSVLGSKLDNVPGARHAYSNAGFSLLAAVVEIVSGQSYEAFVRSRLFGPARMLSTGYTIEDSLRRHLAIGYDGNKRFGVGADKAALTEGAYWNLIGNGGIHSTVGDMSRWMLALRRGRVLKPAALEKLLRPHVLVSENYRSNGPLYYGYGWYVWKQLSGKTVVFHNGGNGIFFATIRWNTGDTTTITYATNTSEFSDSNSPVAAVDRILQGNTISLPPRVLKVPRQLAGRAGRYAAVSGELLDVKALASLIEVRGQGQAAYSFTHGRGWHADSVAAGLNVRAMAAAEGSQRGEYSPLFALFRPGETLKSLGDFEAAFWQKRRGLLGDYVATRLIGTRLSLTRPFPATTVVAFDFARGSTYREYVWSNPTTIADYGPVNEPSGRRFYPVSEDCFVSIDPGSGAERRLCFIVRAGTRAIIVREGGSAIELAKARTK